MNNKLHLRNLLNARTKDYTFAISFLLLFSFFIFFIIRPNLVTGFGLQKELDDLRKIDKDYDLAIQNIVAVQTVIEKNREALPLLREALPSNPQVNQVIDDLKQIASSSDITISKIDINQVNLKEINAKNNLKSYIVHIETQSDFAKVYQFIGSMLNQRRLKSINSLSIVNDTEASGSASLNINMEIDGYYL